MQSAIYTIICIKTTLFMHMMHVCPSEGEFLGARTGENPGLPGSNCKISVRS